MSRLAQVILVLVVTAYPLAVYFGIQYLSLGALLALLLAVAGLRLLLISSEKHSVGGRIGAGALAAILAAVAATSWLRGDSQGLLWYPVFCNLLMLGIFVHSLLFQSQTVIERLARLREPNLPPSGIAYTRRVTQVWCGFFIANGAIAAGTAVNGDLSLWTLYNGLISYLLMGLLLAGEWLLRSRVRRSTGTTT
ncbi:hypothetical protein PVT68_10915 [Microbulbifer bruguierae]|uniref:DNA gyrase subunit B n=1 Tax=Microbulbifer bruguierae TaxID=3029061 RepID=A0ABY8N9F6_9GAMM|nr:hypothetical protein [Microbulbifer bruguierae]WGL15280.1 hypothetical protein PVT68_10915 [Microbulbifer bruguierae]